MLSGVTLDKQIPRWEDALNKNAWKMKALLTIS